MNRFNDRKKEYVIEDMFPKRPWLNYAWNEEHLSCFNQFGFGMSRFRDKNGFLKNILSTLDNRLIFIKDNSSGEYYAANRNYDRKPFDVFQTKVGMGYSLIQSEYSGLAVDLKLFVPTSGLMECWEVLVENKNQEQKDISLYAYADIDMAVTVHYAYAAGERAQEFNGIYCTHEAFQAPTNLSGVYFASDQEIASYETTNRRFKGVYSDIGHPDALKEDALSNQDTCFENEIAAVLQFHLKLAPNEKRKLLFVLGASENIQDAKKKVNEMLSEDVFEREFAKVTEKIERFQNNIMVTTPDEALNSRVNIWLKRQMELGKQWGRLYGKGFRDVMQDTAGFLALDPQNARDRLLYVLQYQREDGNPVRQWEPLEPKVYVDGAVWLIFTLNVYLKETRDFGILDEVVPYYESELEESVMEHCFRGIHYIQNHLGEHGLCLWGDGDWNDSLNGCGILGRGESVWMSEATVKAAREWVEILKVTGNQDRIGDIEEKAQQMKENILKYGWDKDHFIYGFNDYGEKIGSYDSEEGQMFLNTQTWAILAGIVEGEAAKQLMQTVEEKLGCDFGYVQQMPSYSKGTDKIGRSSYFKPGCYENGSVYNHGVAFKVVADCVLGNGTKALETIRKMMPENPKNPYSFSGMEPYAISNMYLGPECASRGGEAPLSWTTGTCGWMFRGIVENMIGVKADYDGLKIEPNFPDEWEHVRIKRVFRGELYDIDIWKREDGSYDYEFL